MKKSGTLSVITIIHIFISVAFSQNRVQIDSLKLLLKNTTSDSSDVRNLLALGEWYYLFKPDSSLYYWEEGLIKANALLQSSNLDSFSRKQIINMRGGLYNDIAFIKQRFGEFPVALEYYEKSYSDWKSTNNSVDMATSLNNSGFVYKKIGNLKKALESFKESLKIREEEGDNVGVAISLYSIGEAYSMLEQDDLALDFFQKSLSIWDKLKSVEIGKSNTLNNIALVYLKKKNYDSAEVYILKGIGIREIMSDKQGLSQSYLNLAQLYKEKGNTKKAKEFSLKALSYAEELKYPENIKNASYFLFKLFTEEKDFEKAIKMLLLHEAMEDSIKETEGKQKDQEQNFKNTYKSMKAEQDKKNLIVAEELKRQKIISYGIAMTGFLVFVLLIVTFRSYRNKRRANTKITEQKKLIEEKQKDILDSIHYAKRIQESLLPTEKYIEKNLKRLKK